ncbi:antitoxin VapB29 [soil metagenome]
MMLTMRTTVDLPDDLHRQAKSIARDTGVSFSDTVVMLMRRALGHDSPVSFSVDGENGLPQVNVGRPITSEDVRSLDDDE